MRRLAVLAVLATVVLAGCSTRVGGEPVAAAGQVPEEATAENVLGDLTTVDPCSLTDPDVFTTFGSADFAPPESLDYCAIAVEPSADVRVLVTVGLLDRLESTPDLAGKKIEEFEDGTYTARRDSSPGFCSQALVFVDEVTLEVGTSTYEGTSPDTCPMVEAAMVKVLEVIENEEVAHREPVTDSLIALDPCSLVEDEAILALPGFEAAKRRDYPGHHQCYWETATDDNRLSVRLVFGAGLTPTKWAAEGNSNPIAGRPTVTNLVPDAGTASFCTIDTGHLPYEEVAGQSGMVELASVFVRMPKGQIHVGCQAAVAVASAVWPQLPTP